MTELQKQAANAILRIECAATALANNGAGFTGKAIRTALPLLRQIERGELREVVTCGECRREAGRDGEFVICGLNGVEKHAYHFCGYGRRKSDANG